MAAAEAEPPRAGDRCTGRPHGESGDPHDVHLTAGPPKLTYVLPIRRWRSAAEAELGAYLEWLVAEPGVEVVVVDGSPPEIFAAHRAAWPEGVRHVPVDADLTGVMGKVNGVVTGVRTATHERVVVADDDVRWDRAGLRRMAALLDRAELVCPQNHFDPLPWHARWDTARTLINRAAGIDFPGTLGVRRSAVLAAGGYDGDTLFENLELIRTVQAFGGRAVSAPDLYVRRLPPVASHFWSQRVRQAYDDLTLPVRFAGELALGPLVAALVARRRFRPVAVGALAATTAAEVGRRRAGGAAIFPASCSLLAPVWLGERAVCAWAALWLRLVRGGVLYAGTRIRKPANAPAVLRRRRQGREPSGGLGRAARAPALRGGWNGDRATAATGRRRAPAVGRR